jgi:hypothetical protein
MEGYMGNLEPKTVKKAGWSTFWSTLTFVEKMAGTWLIVVLVIGGFVFFNMGVEAEQMGERIYNEITTEAAAAGEPVHKENRREHLSTVCVDGYEFVRAWGDNGGITQFLVFDEDRRNLVPSMCVKPSHKGVLA